jgi:hypothetical protein
MNSRLYRRLPCPDLLTQKISSNMKPNNQQKRFVFTPTVLTAILICMAILTAFTPRTGKAPLPVKATPAMYAGYIPDFKMDPATVNSIISGWALDKRIIFQFSVSGGASSEVKAIWYQAGGMDDHAEGEEAHTLEAIPGTTAITLSAAGNYVLANNYLHVKTFKTFFRGLPTSDIDYILFKPTVNPVNNHVYFKVNAVFKASALKKANVKEAADLRDTEIVILQEGLETQPSPPANTGGQ